jgi:hypothetical protein
MPLAQPTQKLLEDFYEEVRTTLEHSSMSLSVSLRSNNQQKSDGAL